MNKNELKDKVVIVCRAEISGEIKENKPVCFLSLDLKKDLDLSILGPNDVKVLHNSILLGVSMICLSFVETKEDIDFIRTMLGSRG